MNPDPLDLLDQTAIAVEAYTGMKQQFVAAGWSERNAERMVIALLNHTAN
ncbi:MAG TPA: hypothetical protein VK054_09420 [Beutenbergiaceae bacterium]|nr:hypothetical protein [Beutenbergiaceae bacterium]